MKRKVVDLNDLKNVAARVQMLNKDLKKLMRQIGAPHHSISHLSEFYNTFPDRF